MLTAACFVSLYLIKNRNMQSLMYLNKACKILPSYYRNVKL